MKIKLSNIVVYSIIIVLVYILFNRRSSGYPKPSRDQVVRSGRDAQYFASPSTRAPAAPAPAQTRPTINNSFQSVSPSGVTRTGRSLFG